MHASYQKWLYKVLSFVVMDYWVTCLKVSHASHDVMYEMSVCMCVKKQTDDFYAIICNIHCCD